MALVNSRPQRIIMLCGLYVAQGVPWGFMLISLPAYLAFKYKVGDADIGRLTAIILLPWSFKLIWAPMMDSITIRSMGRRRPWIIGAQLMMAVTLLGFVGLGNPAENLQYILYMYVLHNCFASLQDVCTDALAIDVLPFAEQGKMNGLMWVSKLIGKGAGAVGLTYVLNAWGLEACVAVQVGVLLLIMLIPMCILERPGEKRFPWSAGQASEAASNVRNPFKVVGQFFRAFSLTTTVVFLVFTLSKLIGSGVNEIVTKTLYTQQLSPRWTDQQVANAAGGYALATIIVGTLLGGFLADRYGRRVILTFGLGGFGLVSFVFAAFPEMWNERWFSMSYILLYEAFNAIASVGFLSMAMRISWTTSAATVFTTYMTLSNISHMTGNFLAGPVRTLFKFGNDSQAANMFSYELTFWFVGLVSLLPLLLLFWVRPEEVDLAKMAENAVQPIDVIEEDVG